MIEREQMFWYNKDAATLLELEKIYEDCSGRN